MARMTITIDLDDGDTLERALNALRVGGPAGMAQFASEEGLAQYEPEQGERPLTVGEPQRRTRRTKAELEAARAAEAQGASGAASSASAGGTVTEAGTGGTTSTTSDGTERPTPPTSSASPGSEGSKTIDDVRKALSDFVAAKSANEAQPILQQFKTADGSPIARIPDMQPKDYAAAIEALKV